MNIENPLDNLQKSEEPPESAVLDENIHEDDSEYQKKRTEYFAAIKKHEVPMANEQRSLLEMDIKDTENVLKKYGTSIDTKDIFSHIHIVAPDFFKEIHPDTKSISGEYASHFGEIALALKETETTSMFAMKSAHEILHYYQFDNRKHKNGEENLDKELMGMMMKSEDKVLFLYMLEAVTQKLAIEVMKLNKDSKVMQEYKWLKEGFKKEPDEDFVLGLGKLRGRYSRPHKPIHSIYKHHVDQFNEMLQEIYEKNREQFKNSDEVFEIFVDAAYSGKKLPIARLIERTYGTQSDILKKIRKIFGKKSKEHKICRE